MKNRINSVKKLTAGASALFAALLILQSAPAVSAAQEKNEASAALPVISVDLFDGRGSFNTDIISANHRFNANGNGMFNPETGEVYKDFTEKTAQSGYGLIRYPAGTIGNLFKWKDSVGPVSQRRQIVLANTQRASETPLYGLDEHMAYVESIGAGAAIMVAEASETPQDAADLVEYLNAPNDGSNPGGGVDYAALRAANGHPEPYGVTYFEIGNEMSLGDQRYWLDYASATGKTSFQAKYSLGDTVKISSSPARKYGTWADNKASGSAGEVLYTQFYPVAEGSQSVFVSGVLWSAVESLEGQAADAAVYMFDPETGSISFGNGVNGKIPEKGASVTVSYSHVHAGFEAYYDAMKAVDPDIIIVSCIEKVYDFIADKSKCDGIVKHDYVTLGKATDAEGLHDAYVKAADAIIDSFVSGDAAVKAAAGRNNAVLAITEYGVIPVPKVYSKSDDNTARDEARSLSRGLHIATILAEAAQTGVRLLIHQGYTAYSFGGGSGLGSAGNVYNALYAPDPEDPSVIIESSMALAYKMFGNGHGDTVFNSFVENNPVVKSTGGDYDSLKVLASGNADGELWLFIVNRNAGDSYNAVIDLNGCIASGNAELSVLNGSSITSCNTPEHPEDVAVKTYSYPVSGGYFVCPVEAHSITVVKVKTAKSAADAYTDALVFEDFGSADPLPAGFTVSGGKGDTGITGTGGERALKITRQGSNSNVSLSLAQSAAEGRTGSLRISLGLMAEKKASRLNIQVKAGGVTVMNLAYDNGMLMCNGTRRCYMPEGEWHELEFVLDSAAAGYVMYLDGEYINSIKAYNNYTTKPIDLLAFDAENSDASFYIDDLEISALPASIPAAVGAFSFVKTPCKKVPGLPQVLDVARTDGSTEALAVTWTAPDTSAFAAVGEFTVPGRDAGGAPVYCIVSVTEPVLCAVRIDKLPDRLTYGPGDELDTAGISVVGVYDNGETVPLGEGLVYTYDFSDGSTVVKVSYKRELTASFDILPVGAGDNSSGNADKNGIPGFVLPAAIAGAVILAAAAVIIYINLKRKKIEKSAEPGR